MTSLVCNSQTSLISKGGTVVDSCSPLEYVFINISSVTFVNITISICGHFQYHRKAEPYLMNARAILMAIRDMATNNGPGDFIRNEIA